MKQIAYLRSELSDKDLLLLIRWMSNEHVYAFSMSISRLLPS